MTHCPHGNPRGDCSSCEEIIATLPPRSGFSAGKLWVGDPDELACAPDGNMSYCRFENTYSDLRDCYEAMDENDLSESETRYRQRIITQSIVDNYGDDDEEGD